MGNVMSFLVFYLHRVFNAMEWKQTSKGHDSASVEAFWVRVKDTVPWAEQELVWVISDNHSNIPGGLSHSAGPLLAFLDGSDWMCVLQFRGTSDSQLQTIYNTHPLYVCVSFWEYDCWNMWGQCGSHAMQQPFCPNSSQLNNEEPVLLCIALSKPPTSMLME